MMERIVDTNVLLVANRKAPQASLACVLACVRFLQTLQKEGKIVLDDQGLIFQEYKQYMSFSGQPGVGDAFFTWMFTNQRNVDRCTQVPITQLAENEFAEFPKDPALARFDPSDRKFVAVAIVHPDRPPIANAVDSDWRDYCQPLADQGVTIEFLCP